jgi:hypothetical protein
MQNILHIENILSPTGAEYRLDPFGRLCLIFAVRLT